MDWLSHPRASLHSIVDAHAASHPDALAAIDDSGEWTYAQLRDASLKLAALLQSRGVVGECAPSWETHPQAPRPLALAMSRGRVWYALCLATWRLGVPLVAASVDMPDKKAERDRNTRIATELRPRTLVVDGDAEAALPSRPSDCAVFQVAELMAVAETVATNSFRSTDVISPESVLMYAYTGGTTKHSKCMVVTNAMALWEMDNYGAVLRGSMGRSDRLLQYSPAYWGAAAFGQLDIALAFGACTVFVPAPRSVDLIAAAVSDYGITVLGTVPSQMRGAWPGGPPKHCTLRVILTWGEKLPVKLSRQWKSHSTVIELLIASEYWLALHSHCNTWHDPADSSDKHILEPLQHLDMLLLGEDGSPTQEGQIGELLLSGPTVSPGYVDPNGCGVGAGKENESAYTHIDGRLYFRTKDRLRKLQGGGLIYCGRGDSLAKRGGAWVDLEAMENTAAAFPGVAMAAIVATEDVHLFVVLEEHAQGPLLHLVEKVKRAVGGECHVHIMSELPRNAATDKVDRRKLQDRLAGVRTREEDWQSTITQVQRNILWSYGSWCRLALLVMVLPSLVLSPTWVSLPAIVAMRMMLLPYLWAVWYYSLMFHGERKYYTWIVGPPDMLMAAASLLPLVCVGPVLAASFGLLAKKRNGKTFYAVSLWVLSGALLWAGLYEHVSPYVSVLVCLVTAACLEPRLVPFFAGLQVSCLMIFPRLLAEDWTWRVRCDYSQLRRYLIKLLVFKRRQWDAALPWDHKAASYEWGMTRRSEMKLVESHEGMGITIQFRYEGPKPRTPAREVNDNSALLGSPPILTPTESALAGLVERAGGNQDSLVGLDSLQIITLAELIRKEMGKDISVKDLLVNTDLKQLAALLDTAATKSSCSSTSPMEEESSSRQEKPDFSGHYRIFTMAFPRHPVDWCVRFDGPGHLDVAALQRATNRLIGRHSALRTVETPDEPIREAMDKAASMWQLCSAALGRDSLLWRSTSKVVGAGLYACWPRTVLRSQQEACVELKIPKGPRMRDAKWDGHAKHDEYVFTHVKQEANPYRWPFEIVVVPMYYGEPEGGCENSAAHAVTLPPEDVSWYIYCSITHAYSDGASGQALLADLIRYYAEESGGASMLREPEAQVAEPLQLLQRRLKPSLRGRLPGESDPNSDVFHEVLDEDWVKRPGYCRKVFLSPQVSQSLRFASTDVLGCSVDVSWLTAIMGAMFRLFPDLPCVHLVLKCGCRDGPNERQMVGFLSENRVFSVDVGDAKDSTLIDVANNLAGTRRQRAWRAPQPFECGMCVYVNIVSAMTGSLPKGFDHIPKASPSPYRSAGPAYAHLNLRIDQLAANDWDIRIFHWDAAWGWEWSTHFVHALGGTIFDMVAAPMLPLATPPHKRDGGGNGWADKYPDWSGNSWSEAQASKKIWKWYETSDSGEKRSADENRQGAEEPPAKLARTAAAAPAEDREATDTDGQHLVEHVASPIVTDAVGEDVDMDEKQEVVTNDVVAKAAPLPSQLSPKRPPSIKAPSQPDDVYIIDDAN